jgi:hypothetical protein
MPPGFVDDMAQTMQALHRPRQEATNVLCSHDQEVFTTYRLVYSSGNSLDFNRCGKKEMKNLFERGTVDEMVSRIDTPQLTSPLQWGKMDVAQMMGTLFHNNGHSLRKAESTAYLYWEVDRPVSQVHLH